MRELGRLRGFTLVEILIVVIIVSIIAAIAIPRYVDQGLKSKEASVRHQLRLLRDAVAKFHADTNRYPLQLDDLAASTPPALGLTSLGVTTPVSGYRGPYIANFRYGQWSDWIAYDIVTPNVGRVRCSRSGTATDGTSYSSW
jgi:general secretion pathway protein G